MEQLELVCHWLSLEEFHCGRHSRTLPTLTAYAYGAPRTRAGLRMSRSFRESVDRVGPSTCTMDLFPGRLKCFACFGKLLSLKKLVWVTFIWLKPPLCFKLGPLVWLAGGFTQHATPEDDGHLVNRKTKQFASCVIACEELPYIHNPKASHHWHWHSPPPKHHMALASTAETCRDTLRYTA